MTPTILYFLFVPASRVKEIPQLEFVPEKTNIRFIKDAVDFFGYNSRSYKRSINILGNRAITIEGYNLIIKLSSKNIKDKDVHEKSVLFNVFEFF